MKPVPPTPRPIRPVHKPHTRKDWYCCSIAAEFTQILLLTFSEHGSDDEDGIKHPFQVNDRSLPNPIQLGLSGFRGGLNTMASRNAITMASMTPAMRDAAMSHRLSEFPVSSGNAHRVKVSYSGECWKQGKLRWKRPTLWGLFQVIFTYVNIG